MKNPGVLKKVIDECRAKVRAMAATAGVSLWVDGEFHKDNLAFEIVAPTEDYEAFQDVPCITLYSAWLALPNEHLRGDWQPALQEAWAGAIYSLWCQATQSVHAENLKRWEAHAMEDYRKTCRS